jgi:hypothetical protein
MGSLIDDMLAEIEGEKVVVSSPDVPIDLALDDTTSDSLVGQIKRVDLTGKQTIDLSLVEGASLDDDLASRVLQKAMEDVVSAGAMDNERVGFHASNLKVDTGKASYSQKFCYRQAVLAQFYKQNRVVHSPKTIALFENGIDLHQRWQRWFERAGVARHIERPHIETNWNLYFTPDAVIELGGVLYIVEIKGYRQEEYWRLIKATTPPSEAYVQANIYAHILNIDDILVLVENKNTQDFKVWPCKYDPALMEPFIPRLNTIQVMAVEHGKTGRLPDRLSACVTPDSPRAKGCSSCQACFLSQQERDGFRL